jgi:formylglycine-generating enzyme required for sulfatase activity
MVYEKNISGGNTFKDIVSYSIAPLIILSLTSTGSFGESGASKKNNIPDIKFVKIPGGTFEMGRNISVEEKGGYDELPSHTVHIKTFWISETEITQKQWKQVTGNNPSKLLGENEPVDNINYYDAKEFIDMLNSISGEKYRLPTEAEWEYIAKEGNSNAFRHSENNGTLSTYAWYDKNSGSHHRPVAQKKPNKWGVYDIVGNVWEWVEDCYHNSYNGKNVPTDGSAWANNCYRKLGEEPMHVVRGGSWDYNAWSTRFSFRSYVVPSTHTVGIGFRIAKDK